MKLVKKIKWAWQRVHRGYDDRIFWEFDSYFATFIPAIKEFCEDELSAEKIKYNPARKKIFTKTLKLAKLAEKCEEDYQTSKSLTDFWQYFGKHINYYWS